MPTITQLHYLQAVASEKHFGRAAELCHVSQPSLSSQIQKLEEELGLIIFDRSKKPIKVTEAGQEIIDQARIVLREHHKLKDIASEGGKEPRGEFHLAVIPTLAPYLIPLFLGEFSARFPAVNLKISEMQTEVILKALKNDEIDCGLLVTPLKDEAIIERHLFYEPFYSYVSKGHALAGKKSIKESDLLEHNLWLLEEGHCFRDQVLKICSLGKQSRVLENVEFASGNLETLKNLVKRNEGYTLIPELAALELSDQEKKINLKPFKKPVPTREVSLVHSRMFLKENAISALEGCIISCLPSAIKSMKSADYNVVEL